MKLSATMLLGTLSTVPLSVSSRVLRQVMSVTLPLSRRPSTLPIVTQSPTRKGCSRLSAMPEKMFEMLIWIARPMIIASTPEVASRPVILWSRTNATIPKSASTPISRALM